MLKISKMLLILASSLFLSYTAQAQANCNNRCENRFEHRCPREKTCNETKHPRKYVGVYFRSDIPASEDIAAFSRPIITLNADGTAIAYFGEALIDFVTEGTISPTYGNWQYVGNNQVLVMTIGYTALEDLQDPSQSTFSVDRDTQLLDFSQSLNAPTIIARSLVSLPANPSSDYLNPNAGTLVFNNPITPRQLQRICAFSSDLTRSD